MAAREAAVEQRDKSLFFFFFRFKVWAQGLRLPIGKVFVQSLREREGVGVGGGGFMRASSHVKSKKVDPFTPPQEALT